MANELKAQLGSTDTGLTLKAAVWNSAGQIWQTTTSTFVTFVLANIANYELTVTERGHGTYTADMPSGISSAGSYPFEFWLSSTKERLTVGTINWDGTAEITGAVLDTEIDGLTTTLGGVSTRVLLALPAGTPGAANGLPTLDSLGGVAVTSIASAITDLLRGIITSGSTQAGSGTSVTLAAGASSVDNIYCGNLISVGTSHRVITAYNGTTKVATLSRALDSADTGSGKTYTIYRHQLPASDVSGGVILASSQDAYYARLQFTRDQANTQDEYTVQWFKNGAPVTSGITSPTLTVTDRGNNVLINAQTMTSIGSTAALKYNASLDAARLTKGESALAEVQATIDGSARTWREIVGRDST